MNRITSRQRRFLRLLWRESRLSRWELHERTGVNATAVGADIAALLEMGIVRECPRTAERPGRPRMPLEIDDSRRQVIGLAIGPGEVEAVKLNLRGGVAGEFVLRTAGDANAAIAVAKSLLEDLLDEQVLAVGVSATGFVDPVSQSISLAGEVEGAHPELLPGMSGAAAFKVEK